MAFSIDLSGLTLLESEISALVAQQSASPTTFTGAQGFTATFKLTGASSASMTTAALIGRVQNLLLTLQQIPL
jgi:hypothetical protein